MGQQSDVEGFGPYGRERHAALSLRWDERRHFAGLQERFGCDRTGAAMALALLSEHDGRGRPVSVSLSRDHYGRVPRAYRSRMYQYRGVRDGFEHFTSEGLVVSVKGSPRTRGWQSFMSPTPRLIEGVRETIAEFGVPKLARPARTVIIRDEHGRIIDKPLTREQEGMQRRLTAINEFLERVDIPGGQGGWLSRIFNLSTRRGGRAYVAGGGFQSLKKEARLRLTIDGEPVVEIDYKALHPSLLYAHRGVPMPSDPYDVPGWPRDVVKRALLILINAYTLRDAAEALSWSEPMQAYMQEVHATCEERRALREAQRLLRDLKQLHAPIADAFHNDTGAALMRIDSDIAEAVMLDLMSKGVVALPVHDSFLVAASKEQLLAEAMVRAAQTYGLPDPKLEFFRLQANPLH